MSFGSAGHHEHDIGSALDFSIATQFKSRQYGSSCSVLEKRSFRKKRGRSNGSNSMTQISQVSSAGCQGDQSAGLSDCVCIYPFLKLPSTPETRIPLWHRNRSWSVVSISGSLSLLCECQSISISHPFTRKGTEPLFIHHCFPTNKRREDILWHYRITRC